MTIETYVSPLDSATHYVVHPAGLSYFDQPSETINKATPSTAYVVGDVVWVVANTISGELWDNSFESVVFVGRRKGVVVSPSASGAATALIQRVPRKAIVCAMGNRVNGMGGEFSNSYRQSTFDLVSRPTPLPLVKIITISKPPAETWGTVFGYISGGVTSYTYLSSIASANNVYWIEGYCCNTSGSDPSVAYVMKGIFSDSICGGLYPTKNSNSSSISASVVGSPVSINANIFCSVDRLSVSGAASSVCSVFIGLCVGVDKSNPIPTFHYVADNNLSACSSVEAINASHGGFDTFFIEEYITRVKLVGAEVTRFDSDVLIGGYNLSGNLCRLEATRIVCLNNDAILPDLAYDPIIPAPFDNARVIWSYAVKNSSNANILPSLSPVVTARSITSAPPFTGMTASNAVKPNYLTTLAPSPNATPLVSVSRNAPYVWRGDNTIGSLSSFRRASFWSGTSYFNGQPLSDYKYRWLVKDFNTGSYSAITSYISGSGAGGAWSVVVTAPSGGNSYDVLNCILDIQPVYVSTTGGTIKNVPDSSNKGVWPYDVLRFFNDSDSGGAWVGSPGWTWPIDASLPSIAWSNEPSFSLIGNVLSLSALVPLATITKDSKFGAITSSGFNQNPSISIIYEDGDSAFICAGPTGVTVGGVAYSKGPTSLAATKIYSGWSWGQPLSMSVYPSRSGSKKITVTLYNIAYVTSVYGIYASPRVITQSFTLP